MGDSQWSWCYIPAKVYPSQLFHGIQYSVEQDLEESKRKRFAKKQHENIYSKGELNFTTLKTTSAIAPFKVLTALKVTSRCNQHKPYIKNKEKERMCKVGSPCYYWNWLCSDMINSWKFGKICWCHISIKIVFQLSLQKDLRILFWSCLIHSWIAGHSPRHTHLPEKAVPFSCAETSSRLSGYQVHVLKCTVILNTLSHLKKRENKTFWYQQFIKITATIFL